MWNLLEFFLVFCIACAFLFLSLLITSLIHFSYRHVSPCSNFFVNMLYFLCISIFITSNNLIDCLHLIVSTKNTSDNLFYKNTIVTILFYFIFWHSSQLGLQIFYIGNSSAIKLMCNVFLRMVFQPFLCRWHVWWHVFQPYRFRWHVCWHKKRKALNWKEQHILMNCPE